MVYPRKALKESGLEFGLTSYCDFGDGKHTPLDDVHIPSCEQKNNKSPHTACHCLVIKTKSAISLNDLHDSTEYAYYRSTCMLNF